MTRGSPPNLKKSYIYHIGYKYHNGLRISDGSPRVFSRLQTKSQHGMAVSICTIEQVNQRANHINSKWDLLFLITANILQMMSYTNHHTDRATFARKPFARNPYVGIFSARWTIPKRINFQSDTNPRISYQYDYILFQFYIIYIRKLEQETYVFWEIIYFF